MIKYIYRPALRDCEIDRRGRIGSGSNCIMVALGKYSYMGANNSVCNTVIGSFCSIASYCAIGGGEHPVHQVSTSPIFLAGKNIFNKNFAQAEFEDSERVVIGNDVWIGEGVFIRGGVSIGDGAVVGAHSVVTHDVRPYAVVVGAPAKEIHRRFSDDVVNGLLKLKWWDWDDDRLYENAALFANPKALLESEGLL
ncbi:CatB-related O-acetyltransferase [Olsenella profusa]|uniref:CatB-related O-acetyltransferase n=2 Tax=Olsenella profusa TaxID=138595 RepID=A0ABS2F310_9ACTN|nr:CatB-related O-acetyltransferase [Olsenella profusa]